MKDSNMSMVKQGEYLVLPLKDLEKRFAAVQRGCETDLPLVRVEDQKSAVLCCEFHPSGDFFLSANRAGQIRLDSMSSRVLQFEAHGGAVMEAHFCRDGTNIFSCSEDQTISIWDAFAGMKTCSREGHSGIVNSVQSSRSGYPVLCSGGQDGTVRIWDSREEHCAMTLESGSEVNSTLFSDCGDYVFSGGQDRCVSIWDLRTSQVISSLDLHTGAITGLALSPCGSYVLSHSLDNTLRIWDVRPYSLLDRAVKCYASGDYYPSGLLRCAWSPDGGMISAGTSGCVAQVLDASNGSKLLDLAPHGNSVNDVAFHPDDAIMLSASNDNCLFLHELNGEN